VFQHAHLEEFQQMEILLDKNTAILNVPAANIIILEHPHAQIVQITLTVKPVILQLLQTVINVRMEKLAL